MELDKKTELINGIILLLSGVSIWWYSNSFPSLEEGYPGPALFPKLISVGLGLSGVFLLMTIFLQKNDASTKLEKEHQEHTTKPKPIQLGLGIILVSCYPLLHQYLGFIVALSLVCFAIAILLKVRIWIAAITALSTALLIYVIFSQLLGVTL